MMFQLLKFLIIAAALLQADVTQEAVEEQTNLV